MSLYQWVNVEAPNLFFRAWSACLRALRRALHVPLVLLGLPEFFIQLGVVVIISLPVLIGQCGGSVIITLLQTFANVARTNPDSAILIIFANVCPTELRQEVISLLLLAGELEVLPTPNNAQFLEFFEGCALCVFS